MINNAFRNVARSTLTKQPRRMNSSGYSNTFVTADKKYSFSKSWFNDRATYPIISILGAAACFCSGFGLYFLTNAKDVRINPTKRHELIRRHE